VRTAAIAPSQLSLEVVEDSDDLVARLAAGDDAALREAYRQHRDGVRTFARRLLDDGAAAEDLVHEVFVALPRAARRFRGDTSLRQFLISMAVNHARHHVRAAARRRRAQQRLGQQPVAPTVTPERAAENQQLGRALAAALDQLPLDLRVAFVLCELEERSSAEAARIVGTSDGNMRLRLFNARRRLRSLLDAWRTRQPRKDTE
jgi:RNA polymerase sigma-70 factor (ECF subfamily)